MSRNFAGVSSTRAALFIAIFLIACSGARPAAAANQIQNRGKCLTVRGNRAANATPILLWHCTGPGNAGQLWFFRQGQLVSRVGTNMCLTVRGGRPDDGTEIILWACGTSQDRAQQFYRAGRQLHSVVNGGNGCLNVQGGLDSDGTPIILYHCQGGGAVNELWDFFASN